VSGPRVLALIDTWQVSGPGRQLAALAHALQAHGIDLQIGCVYRRGRPEPPFLDYLRRQGLPAHLLAEAGPFDPGLPLRAARLADQVGADILQTHSYKTTVVGWILRTMGRSRRPWLAFFHGATAENRKVQFYNRIDRLLLPRADRLVVMSHRDAAAFGGAGARVRVLHNAILPRPAPAPAVSLAVEDLPHPRMLFLGRLSPEKGLDVLLAALRQVAGRIGACSLMVAGDGPERAALETAAGTLPESVRVRFLGHLPDGMPALAAADLLVLPSRSEGLPNALLEALGIDLPVIATAVGAIPEVLGDTGAFLIVPPDDPAALAAAILDGLRLIEDREARAGRASLRERLSLARRVEAHLALYHELFPRR